MGNNNEEKKGSQDISDTMEISLQELQDALKEELEDMDNWEDDREDAPGDADEMLEDKIEQAMQKIVTDTVGEPSESEQKAAEAPVKSEEARPTSGNGGSPKSARPKSNSMTPIEFESLTAAAEEADGETSAKKHKGLKITGVIFGMLLVAAGCAYAGVSYYYTDKFFEGTVINGVDCSNLTAIEVEEKIAANVEDYQIVVNARNQQPETILGSEINYKYMSNGDILNILQKQKPYEWAMGYFRESSYAAEENVTYDKSLLEAKLQTLSCSLPENQVAPQDAYITYKDTHFEIVPENQGSALIARKAYQALAKAVSQSTPSIDLDQEGVYQTAAVRQDDPKLQETLAVYQKYTSASITYNMGETTEVLDGMTIKDWLTTNEDGSLVKDEESFNAHIEDYVAALAEKYDTLYTDREFTSTEGRTVTVYAYNYGWVIDQDAEIAQLKQEIEAGEAVQREPNYSMTANSHGDSDVGDTYIEVDLGMQHMYYYKQGVCVFDCDFISGKPDGVHDTRAGIFTLYNKESPSVLRGEMQSDGKREYETQVTFWMAFDGGIGFHDATWQYNGFGGSLYAQGYGSHGCVNLSYDSAAQLYNIIEWGDPIVCFY